jgi:hypothetical protein
VYYALGGGGGINRLEDGGNNSEDTNRHNNFCGNPRSRPQILWRWRAKSLETLREKRREEKRREEKRREEKRREEKRREEKKFGGVVRNSTFKGVKKKVKLTLCLTN